MLAIVLCNEGLLLTFQVRLFLVSPSNKVVVNLANLSACLQSALALSLLGVVTSLHSKDHSSY